MLEQNKKQVNQGHREECIVCTRTFFLARGFQVWSGKYYGCLSQHCHSNNLTTYKPKVIKRRKCRPEPEPVEKVALA